MYTYMTFTKDDNVVRLVGKECSLMNDSTSLHLHFIWGNIAYFLAVSPNRKMSRKKQGLSMTGLPSAFKVRNERTFGDKSSDCEEGQKFACAQPSGKHQEPLKGACIPFSRNEESPTVACGLPYGKARSNLPVSFANTKPSSSGLLVINGRLLFCHKVSWSLLTCHWNWNDVKLFIGKLQDLEPFNSHNPMTKENQPRMAGGLPNRSQCYVFIMTPWEQKGKDDLHSRIKPSSVSHTYRSLRWRKKRSWSLALVEII